MQNDKNKKAEVAEFLSSFQDKRRTFEIIFIDRPKNKQSLLDLEIRPIDREKFIDQLTIEDFLKDHCQKIGMEVRKCGYLVKKSKSKKFISKFV